MRNVFIFLVTSLLVTIAMAGPYHINSQIACGKIKSSGIKYIEDQETQTFHIGFRSFVSGRMNSSGQYEIDYAAPVFDGGLPIILKYESEVQKAEAVEFISTVRPSKVVCVVEIYKSARRIKYEVVATGQTLDSAILNLKDKYIK